MDGGGPRSPRRRYGRLYPRGSSSLGPLGLGGMGMGQSQTLGTLNSF
jgi:hypothetical protein